MNALVLASTTDKIQLTTGTAADVDVVATFVPYDHTASAEPVAMSPDRQVTAITTATTTDIVDAPAGSGGDDRRVVKAINIRNKDSADSTIVTVIYDANGTDYQLFAATLAPGEVLSYVEGVGWFEYASTSRLNLRLVTTGDVTNATTSFADVTGLSCAVEAGKTYTFEAHLLYQTNATTTGARFGINGPALTYLRLAGIGTVTVSATAAAFSTQGASVSAVDTSAIGAQTTGPGTVDSLAIIGGTIVPSAAGTFVIRCQSEVAVASGLVVRRGSWLDIREADNT